MENYILIFLFVCSGGPIKAPSSKIWNVLSIIYWFRLHRVKDFTAEDIERKPQDGSSGSEDDDGLNS